MMRWLLLLLLPLVSSQTGDRYCSTSFCVTVLVPDAQNLLFLISFPTNAGIGWMGVGTGAQMRGSEMMVVFNNGAPIVSRRFGFGESEPEAASDQTPFVLLNADSSSVSPITSRIALALQLYSNYTAGQNFSAQATLPTGSPGSQLTTRATTYFPAYNAVDKMVTTFIVVRPQNSSNSNVKIGTADFIWAMSSISPPLLNQDVSLGSHDIGRGTFSLNLTNPTSLLATEPWPFTISMRTTRDLRQNLLTAHGTLIVFAWSMFSILGVFSAAVLRHMRDRWFKLHAGFQLTAIVMTLAGFGFAVAMVTISNQGHFIGPHAIFGLVFTVLSVGQGVIGWMAHAKFDAKREQRPVKNNVHIILGHFLFATAPAQIWSRLTTYGNLRQKVIFVVWTFMWIATLLGIRMWRYFMRAKAVPAFDSHRHASDIDGEYDFARGKVEHIPEDDGPRFQNPFSKSAAVRVKNELRSDSISKDDARRESEALSPPLPSPPGRSISQRIKTVFGGRTNTVEKTATGGVPIVGLRRSDTMTRLEKAFSWKAGQAHGNPHSAEWDVS